jgi:type IV pilus assembly protein PilW
MNTVVPRNKRMQHPSGFTLVELLVAMVISALVLTAFYRVFDNLQSSSLQQVEMATMQQNQRGALAIMEREFRMIAADRGLTGQFRVTDIRRYTVTEPGTTATPDNSAAGSPILRFTADLDNDGLLGANETITYLLYDRDGDPANGFDLARSVFNAGNGLVSQRDLLAESVDAIGFAYAFDQNLDGRIDRAGANDDIIWGVDTDNDGLLDADMANTALGFTVQPSMIRSVRLWILGRAQRGDNAFINDETYTLANRILPQYNDNMRRWMINQIINCRNL